MNKYWDSIGKYLLLVCMAFFVAFAFKATTVFAYWSYLREFKKGGVNH